MFTINHELELRLHREGLDPAIVKLMTNRKFKKVLGELKDFEELSVHQIQNLQGMGPKRVGELVMFLQTRGIHLRSLQGLEQPIGKNPKFQKELRELARHDRASALAIAKMFLSVSHLIMSILNEGNQNEAGSDNLTI